MTQTEKYLQVEVRGDDGQWRNFGGVVFNVESAIYLYEMCAKGAEPDSVRITPREVEVMDDEAGTEVPSELVKEAAARLLADTAERAKVWNTSEADALSVSWREMADGWPALAAAVADTIGWEPPA